MVTKECSRCYYDVLSSVISLPGTIGPIHSKFVIVVCSFNVHTLSHAWSDELGVMDARMARCSTVPCRAWLLDLAGCTQDAEFGCVTASGCSFGSGWSARN